MVVEIRVQLMEDGHARITGLWNPEVAEWIEKHGKNVVIAIGDAVSTWQQGMAEDRQCADTVQALFAPEQP